MTTNRFSRWKNCAKRQLNLVETRAHIRWQVLFMISQQLATYLRFELGPQRQNLMLLDRIHRPVYLPLMLLGSRLPYLV
jgi:hypothetical protein